MKASSTKLIRLAVALAIVVICICYFTFSTAFEEIDCDYALTKYENEISQKQGKAIKLDKTTREYLFKELVDNRSDRNNDSSNIQDLLSDRMNIAIVFKQDYDEADLMYLYGAKPSFVYYLYSFDFDVSDYPTEQNVMEALNYIASHGGDVSEIGHKYVNGSNTPLSLAADKSLDYVVDFLLEKGALPDQSGSLVDTPLIKLCRHSYTSTSSLKQTRDYNIASSLIKNGANVNHNSVRLDKSRKPVLPLEIALDYPKDPNIKLIKLLLDNGAKFENMDLLFHQSTNSDKSHSELASAIFSEMIKSDNNKGTYHNAEYNCIKGMVSCSNEILWTSLKDYTNFPLSKTPDIQFEIIQRHIIYLSLLEYERSYHNDTIPSSSTPIDDIITVYKNIERTTDDTINNIESHGEYPIFHALNECDYALALAMIENLDIDYSKINTDMHSVLPYLLSSKYYDTCKNNADQMIQLAPAMIKAGADPKKETIIINTKNNATSLKTPLMILNTTIEMLKSLRTNKIHPDNLNATITAYENVKKQLTDSITAKQNAAKDTKRAAY